MERPKVRPSEEMGVQGVIMVNDGVLKLGHIFRETSARDYGIDGQIEITTSENGEKYASGKLLAVQIKSGSSHFRSPNDDGWSFYCKAAHINYWREHSLPDNPYWFYGAMLAEMGHDLTYQRVLPAVISALVSHFRNNAISAETFFSSPAGDLQGWQVGLA